MSCELCERPAGDAYLCPSCEQDTADRLHRLPVLYAQLGAMLAPASSRDGGRGGTVVVAPVPLRLDVADARAAFSILPTWARALADDRRRPAPTPGADDLGARVTAACAALAEARAWIAAEWPAAGDLAREVQELHDDARSVVGADDLPARMGLCPAVQDGARCGALLVLSPGQQVIRCDWCGATYPPGVWAQLRREQAAVA